MMTVHNFQADLSASHVQSLDPIWNTLYQQKFPTIYSSSLHNHDLALQKAGVDRCLFLPRGKVIHIDEKVRYQPYVDIALEEWSAIEDGSPGWTEKPLLADYVAYL